MTEPLHLFLHIPKTAGVTIHDLAKRQYPAGATFIVNSDPYQTIEDLAAWPPEERRKLRYIGGHFSYGFHRRFARPCQYATMLRDPAELLVSCYHYIKRRPGHPDNLALVKGKVPFELWLQREWCGHIDNHQLRCMLAKWPPEPITRDDLELAKRLLAEEFAAFGLVDRFDESLLFLQDAFGWRDLAYTKRNVFRRDSDADVLTPEARALIAQHHAMSIELVAFARQLFEARVQARG